ncbi:hypothetical protein [Dickeya phage Amaethon]|nr:hypothetical protein [Dickeya phage Amaethon]
MLMKLDELANIKVSKSVDFYPAVASGPKKRSTESPSERHTPAAARSADDCRYLGPQEYMR